MKVHPSEIMTEEMESRGWDRDRLAVEMVSGSDDSYGIVRLALDLYFEVGPTDPRVRIGARTAEQLGRAFGVSPEFFLNLERSYLEGKIAEEAPKR